MQSRSSLWSFRPRFVIVALLLAALAGVMLWLYVDRANTPPRDSFALVTVGGGVATAPSTALTSP